MSCHKVALFSLVLEDKLSFLNFSDGSPSSMHSRLDSHSHKRAVFTLICVSKGGAGGKLSQLL